jgi:Phosphotransferase enzyme family
MRPKDVVPYLLERHLVDSADVMRPDFSVMPSPRRNNNFKVINGHGASLLLKQAVSADRALTVAHEAATYATFTDNTSECRWLAPFHGYDEDAAILVLGLLVQARTLREHVTATGRASQVVAASLGRELADIHSRSPLMRHGRGASPYERPPWILQLACPDASVLDTSSAAALQLIRLVQSSDALCASIDEMRDDWRSDTFVHGDLRWDNCLVTTGSRHPQVTIIDWEMCRTGDAAWDLGTLFCAYLRLWLTSVPLVGDRRVEESLDAARFVLEDLQPATRALWHGYLGTRDSGEEPAGAFAIRVARHTGANLLQSVFEEAQAAAVFSPHLAYRLQLAANMMERPAEAAVHLLGLDLHGAR